MRFFLRARRVVLPGQHQIDNVVSTGLVGHVHDDGSPERGDHATFRTRFHHFDGLAHIYSVVAREARSRRLLDIGRAVQRTASLCIETRVRVTG